MLKNLLIVIAGVGVAFLLFIFVLNLSNRRAEKLVQLLYVEKNTAAYRQLADSFLSKLIIGSKQRQIFDMTYYRMTGEDEKLEETFASLGKRKLSPQEDFERFQNMFQYYLKNERYEELEKEYNRIIELYGTSEDIYTRGTLKEFGYMYSVDYKGDVSLLKEIEDLYGSITVEQSKGIFAFRCYHLYLLKNDKKKADKYRKLAAEYLGNDVVKEMISIQHLDRISVQ